MPPEACQSAKHPAGPPARDPAGHPGESREAGGRGREILIVDDNQVNTMILATMLRKAGWTPLTAADGIEGIAACARLRPRLVLMDLQMPRLDGFAAAREILSASAGRDEAPVIVAVTAAPGPDARARCAAAGFDDLLAKPVEMAELLALVERHLGPA